LTNFVDALEATPTVPFDTLPRNGIGGTYFSLAHPDWPPLPADTAQVPVWQMSDFYMLNDLGFDYDAAAQAVLSPHLRFSMDVPVPGGGGGGGGTNTPDGSGYILPDYGTNLWIAQWAMTNNTVAGIASNTVSDVQYEVLTTTNLTATKWISQGFIYGSETTNWTPLNPMLVAPTNNLFVRLKSWQSSNNSGIPDWWWTENFGQATNIDPYADPAGDGYSNYQKFELGLKPNVFYTPPAPRGLATAYNGNTGNMVFSWLPNPGPVTGYSVTIDDYQSAGPTSFTVPATQTSVADNILDDIPYNPASDGSTLLVDCSVQAIYAGGNSPSADIFLEDSSFRPWLVAGQQGSAFIAVAPLPTGTASFRLTRVDNFAESGGDSSMDTNFVISIATGTNGLYPIPADLLNAPVDNYGMAQYNWFVQALNATNGAITESKLVSSGYNPNSQVCRLVPPYVDARAALKDNLQFLLRAANAESPFTLCEDADDAQFDYYRDASLISQTNYVCEGFFQCVSYGHYGNFGNYQFDGFYPLAQYDPLMPLEENYIFRNLVYSSADVDAYGNLNTGVMGGRLLPSSGNALFIFSLLLNTVPKYAFDLQSEVSTGNNTTFSSVLQTNEAQWLKTADFDAPIYASGSDFTVGSATNIYGLPISSIEQVYQANSQLYSGNYAVGSNVPTNASASDYIAVQEPDFQTVDYYFARPGVDPFPEQNNPYCGADDGTPSFSVTNQSPLTMLPVGIPTQIAGYAKMEVLNG
jgi:hypothetical protein